MVTTMLFCVLSGMTLANEPYDAGASWASQNKGQSNSAITDFDPADTFPDYTDSPSESSYYGGVTSTGIDLAGPGTSALTTSEAGKTITESILNTPADNTPSLDAPYIAEGLSIQEQAETITGGGFDGCVDQVSSFSEITTHQCLRDTKVEQVCTRTATITGDYVDSTRTETHIIALKDAQQDGSTVKVSFVPPVSGTIISAEVQFYITSLPDYQNVSARTLEALGGSVTVKNGQNWHTLAGAGYQVSQDVPEVMNIVLHENYSVPYFAGVLAGNIASGHITLNLRITLSAHYQQWVPRVEWSESCPFSKEEGALTGSTCVEPEETRTVVVGGETYSINQACWKYQDTYLTQTETEGTCGEYISDSACSVIRSECADTVDGFCVSQQVTYSCERTTTANGKICGGEFFCTDGSCAQAQTGTSNMFGQAVSALAAVAAAGEDVAELNGENVRAFTGEAKSCKKFAAGFNNCCKDSGWGQDVGLSSCSSDEKALGKAKEKKLTVYVGEYCSKKVLGVCLEKKRGYCQFDSKLARIVQEQGRRDQLGVGFGSGSSPDCRGITVDELQALDFGIIDFSDFYSDLDAGSDIPEDQALLEKAQSIIADKMAEGTP